MSKAVVLDYEGLMEYALQHYEQGGDMTYECWGRREFDEYVAQFGPITKSKALKMFRRDNEYRHEIESTAW